MSNFNITNYPLQFRGGVESNQTNFKLDFMDYFSHFESIEFQIFELDKFRMNPIFNNLTQTSS